MQSIAILSFHSSRGRHRRTVQRVLVLLVLPLLLAACKEDEIKPVAQGPDAHFTVLGDSLSAGHQNGCTEQSQQDFGYAKVIARQAGWTLNMPYISAPGARPCMMIGETGNLLSIRRQPVPDPDGVLAEGNPDDFRTWGTRVDPTLRSGNLSSPGTRVVDAIDPSPTSAYHINFGLDYAPLWALFADTPDNTPNVSLLEQALARIDASSTDNDVVIVWLAGNDILWSAFAGSAAYATPVGTFDAAFDSVLGQLAETGAKIAVANMPDVTVTPHFLTAEEAVAAFGLTLDTVVDPGTGATASQVLGLVSGEYVPMMTGLAAIGAILTGATVGPLPRAAPVDVVLTLTDIAALQAIVAGYNAAIATAATTYGAALVDVNALLADADAIGLPVGGETLTTALCGGLFSLDGVHPSVVGYAAIANEFIAVLNTAYGLGIPQANLAAVRFSEIPKNRCIAG